MLNILAGMLNILARLLAASIAIVYSFYLLMFGLAFLFGGSEGFHGKSPVLRDLTALAYLAGVAVLGVAYALRPFRFGLVLLALVSLGVWTYSHRKWEAYYVNDPIGHRTSGQLVAEYLDDGPDRADLESIRYRADGRYSRLHVNAALLEAADSLKADDTSLERIVTALGEIGYGRDAEEFLRNVIERTSNDGEKARLHHAAESALESVERGALPLQPSSIHFPIPPYFGHW